MYMFYAMLHKFNQTLHLALVSVKKQAIVAYIMFRDVHISWISRKNRNMLRLDQGSSSPLDSDNPSC